MACDSKQQQVLGGDLFENVPELFLCTARCLMAFSAVGPPCGELMGKGGGGNDRVREHDGK
jgi:hypothetical protein